MYDAKDFCNTRLEFTRNARFLGSAIAAVGMLCHSAAYGLERSEALSILNKSDFFPRYESLAPLPIGNPVNIEVVIKTVMNQDSQLGNELDTGYACAQRLGLLSIRGNQKTVFGTNMGTFYTVVVTAKGDKSGWVVNENVYGYKSGYVLPIYKKTAVRVTGIKKSGPGSAIVDFDTGVSEVLSAGRCVHPNIEELKRTVIGKHRATLELYDDGWRVEGVKAKGKRLDWVPLKPERID